MQIGDTVLSGNLIGIVSAVDSDIVVLKCHDGLSHPVHVNTIKVLVPARDTLLQYEEAIQSYGKQKV